MLISQIPDIAPANPTIAVCSWRTASDVDAISPSASISMPSIIPKTSFTVSSINKRFSGVNTS
jgi:hypothetical protein